MPILNNSKTLTAMSCFPQSDPKLESSDFNLIQGECGDKTMSQLILYYQPDCHLCDEAEVLLHAIGMAGNYQEVDIESDLELLKRYGIHVPVLQRGDNQKELFWPFDQGQVEAFIRADT
jgi:glutaredoxin